jgi:predicted RNA-binding protein with PIN domain
MSSPLPEPVRLRVVGIAAAALGTLADEAVPASLRRVARFTPGKRARLGHAELLAAVRDEPAFHQHVLAAARATDPALARLLADGAPLPPGTDSVEAAALGWLMAAPGWEQLLATVARGQEQEAAERAERADAAALSRLAAELAAAREKARAEVAQARLEADQARTELTAVRRKLRETGARLGRAEQAAEQAERAVEQAQEQLAAQREEHAAQLRRMSDRLTEAEHAAARTRGAAREGARGDQLRLRLLLDAVVGAAQGLRRELALPPAEGRPADALEGDYTRAPAGPTTQGRLPDDPGLLDALLAVPTTHLLVDGYNVTKTGYPTFTLEAQRARLLAGLGALAARTGAEVTVVFDGVDAAVPVAVPAPRGVRLLFSRTGETADEVLRRLAHHEPGGRPVVVVSSDREVADGVRLAGAHAVPSLALLRLLER